MSAIFDTEIKTILGLAQKQGLSDVEVFAKRSSGLTLKVSKGQIENFQLSDSVGLGVRVLLGERAGYSYTENLGSDALLRALSEAESNARLVEPKPGTVLAGEAPLPEHVPSLYNKDLENIPLAKKIELAKALEADALAADPRIKVVPGCVYSEGRSALRIANSRGLDRHYETNLTTAAVFPLASENGENKTYTEILVGRDFYAIDAKELATKAALGAVGRLGAKELPSGHYPVVFSPKAMVELLSAFAGLFSAKAALEGKSLLEGKEGALIASPLFTLMDDPLLVGGLESRPFDDEGVSSRPLAVVEKGVFTSFLHNSQTARCMGRASTGHAARGSYKGVVGVAPSNFFIQAGEASSKNVLSGENPVVLIDDLQGLHAGTNPISGDFSLAAQGVLYEGGLAQHPVHNFTVSGNFLTLLTGISAVGDDLRFYPQGAFIGSPSVRVEGLAIAGS
jgi:PmbA protein